MFWKNGIGVLGESVSVCYNRWRSTQHLNYSLKLLLLFYLLISHPCICNAALETIFPRCKSHKTRLCFFLLLYFPLFFCLSYKNIPCNIANKDVTCGHLLTVTVLFLKLFFSRFCVIHGYTRTPTAFLHTSVQGHYTKWDKDLFIVSKITEAELMFNIQTNIQLFSPLFFVTDAHWFLI